jgi:predicted nucleotidyltransferase
VNAQLDAVVARLRETLSEALIGIYLHGSLALGCFNQRCSDIDLLVVTRRPLDDGERVALRDLPHGFDDRPGWPRPLELSVLTADQLRPWRQPTPYDFHLSSAGVSGPGLDGDLAAHVTVTRRAGVVLFGPAPAEVFPEVPRADFVAALRSDLDHCLGPNAAPAYAILSLARIWASLAEPDVLHTKVSGAEWALARLPPATRPPLERALASYRGDGGDVDVAPDELTAYAAYAAERARDLCA